MSEIIIDGGIMKIDLEKLTPAPWGAAFNPQFPGVGADIVGPNGIIADRVNDKDKKKGRLRTPEQMARLPEGHSGIRLADAMFIVLARNAFDVQMRRGWSAVRGPEGWWLDCTWDGADDEDNWTPSGFQAWLSGKVWDDPFTALVEADAWHRANVEGRP